MSRLSLLICALVLLCGSAFADISLFSTETPAPTNTPAATFSDAQQTQIKEAAEAIISNLPTTLDVNVTGTPSVDDYGVVTITASVEGGCATVTANQADFQGTGANTFTVACAEVTTRRRLLAATSVSLTFTPTQGPTYAPAPTTTNSPASSAMPSALAFIAVVVAAIAF